MPSNADVPGINGGTYLIDSTVAAECNQMRGPGWVGGGGLATLNITGGTLEQVYPIQIDARDGAEFIVIGGLGYVPVTFKSLCNFREFTLQRKGGDKWIEVDQSYHGNDFWQTDYDARTGSWEITYSLWLDNPDDSRIPTEFRLMGPGLTIGDANYDHEADI